MEDFCVTEALKPLWKNEAFHTAIEYSLFTHDHQNRPNDSEYEEVFEYNKANYDVIKQRIQSIDWQLLLQNEGNIDHAIEKFYLKINEICCDLVPKRRRRRTRNANHPPWFTKEIKNLRNRKQKAHRCLKTNPCLENVQSYETICAQLEVAINIAVEEYNQKVEHEIKSNSKTFFSYVNSKLKSGNFPSNMHLDGQVENDPGKISNLFAKFFQNVYTTHSENERDREYFSFQPESTNEVVIDQLNVNEIHTALKTLDSSKGPGPDGIPPVFLKNTATELTKPLFWLYNLSLKTSTFPAVWKKSFLVPIYKSGKKSDIRNYRGIAIISCIPKLFEAIVNEKIFNQVKHQITDQQHGFFKGRSTATNLLQFVSFALNTMDNKNFVQTLYTDFSKAFDRIDIPMLLFKLQKYGMHINLLNWLESYLTNRIQHVKFNGRISNLINVTSGVPQGSHLGPLLFILYVNDVSFILKYIKVLIYADDMKLYMEIEKCSDIEMFQQEIDIFYEWCQKSLLELNVKKCNSISFTRKMTTPNIIVTLGNEPVSKIIKVRDLGVVLDSKLSFTEHYNTIIHRASNMLSFIKRFSFNFQDPYTIKALFVAYVRSILEYCSVVWSPYQATHEDRIESVQKQFLLFALRKLNWTEFPLPSYDLRCKLINIQTLKKRREFALTSFVHDLIMRRIDCPTLLERLSFNAPVRNLRTTNLFHIKTYRTDYAQNEPINRMMRHYNNLNHCEMLDITMPKYKLKNLMFNKCLCIPCATKRTSGYI